MVSDDVERWVDCRLDDVYGARIGTVCGVYVDRESQEPIWLLARTGRTRPEYHAIPRAGAGCGNGSVWIPFLRGTVLSSPPIFVRHPVSPPMEAALCRHYDVPTTRGAQLHRWEPSALVAVGNVRDAGAWAAVVATGGTPVVVHPAAVPGFATA